MTLADEFRQLEVDLADLFGQSATLRVQTSATYDTDGSVVEVTADHDVTIDGPVSETSRYAAGGSDESITATFYLPAQGLTVTPKKANRIVVGTREWQVVSMQSFQVQGTTHVYRLDCAEVAADA